MGSLCSEVSFGRAPKERLLFKVSGLITDSPGRSGRCVCTYGETRVTNGVRSREDGGSCPVRLRTESPKRER